MDRRRPVRRVSPPALMMRSCWPGHLDLVIGAVTGFSTSSRHPAALRSAGRASRLWLRPRSCLRPARRCRCRRAPAVDRPEGMSRDQSAGQRHASGGGATAPGWRWRRSRVPAGAWRASWGSHPDHLQPRQSRAVAAQGVKVVRTVARSTLTPLNHACSTGCGSTADGMGAWVSGGLRWVVKAGRQAAGVPHSEMCREASVHQLRPLAMFFAWVLTLAILVLALACGLLAYSHRGLSVDLFQALALLVLCFALLMACSKILTGRWHRWSKGSDNTGTQ